MLMPQIKEVLASEVFLHRLNVAITSELSNRSGKINTFDGQQDVQVNDAEIDGDLDLGEPEDDGLDEPSWTVPVAGKADAYFTYKDSNGEYLDTTLDGRKFAGYANIKFPPDSDGMTTDEVAKELTLDVTIEETDFKEEEEEPPYDGPEPEEG